jgi:DNA-binding CsgD family transcriptional regulator
MTAVRRDCRCPKARHKHGTTLAYNIDRCRCFQCRVAKSRSAATYRAGGRWTDGTLVPSIGTVRRLRALAAAGVTSRRVAAAAGISYDMVQQLRRGHHRFTQRHIADSVARAYDQLWDKGGVDHDAKCAASMARRHGYHPPLAWDDDTIDDPDATPIRKYTLPRDRTIVDDIAVQEAIAGRRTRLTKAERQAATLLLTERGLGANEIARILATTSRTIVRRRKRAA